MEYSPSRPDRSTRSPGKTQASSKMSLLAMATPTPHAPFRRDYAWEDSRSPSSFAPSRPRTEPERIALPSIRQAFPELQLRIQAPEASARTSSTTTSPVVGAPGPMSPPEYTHSPNSSKRRRLSIDDEADERASRIPRLYTSPIRADPRQAGGSPTLAPRSATDNWISSARNSPLFPTSAGPTPMRSPLPMEPSERVESRPTLPSFPLPSLDREAAAVPRMRGNSSDDYVRGSSRAPVMVHGNPPPGMDTTNPAYRQGTYPFSYHHPTRVQSLSLGAIHPFDRSPLTAVGYGPYQDYMRMSEFGAMGLNGDNKQRKRRGNLPKETTDKLRAWFHAHLHHPYPTEDEKQDLMRQTGLQMNQISNWFINARRRQLPQMINSARAESDAMTSGRPVDGKILPSTERAEYGDAKGGSPVSDGGNHFDDDLEALKHRRPRHMKRGSV